MTVNLKVVATAAVIMISPCVCASHTLNPLIP
jgi:hypothetical protein